MDNKGFTLIELLATICLLAVIAVISFVSINGVLNKSKISDCENLISNIKSATKEYVSDNRYSGTFDEDNNKFEEITTKTLLEKKYLSSNVKDDAGNVMIANPFNGENIAPENIRIEVTLNSDLTANSITIKNAFGEVHCDSGEW